MNCLRNHSWSRRITSVTSMVTTVARSRPSRNSGARWVVRYGGGDAAPAPLAWCLIDNNATVMSVLLLVIGVAIFGKGLAGL